MRLPIDSEVMSPVNEEEIDLDGVIQQLIQSRKQVFQEAKSSITTAQKKQKETYDRKHLPGELAVGTQILLENTTQKQRKGGKLEPAWLGPYTINGSIGKGVYELCKDGNILKKKVNIARLKVYKKRCRDDMSHSALEMVI